MIMVGPRHRSRMSPRSSRRRRVGVLLVGRRNGRVGNDVGRPGGAGGVLLVQDGVVAGPPPPGDDADSVAFQFGDDPFAGRPRPHVLPPRLGQGLGSLAFFVGLGCREGPEGDGLASPLQSNGHKLLQRDIHRVIDAKSRRFKTTASAWFFISFSHHVSHTSKHELDLQVVHVSDSVERQRLATKGMKLQNE
jgi:hypothetical protein